jgi:NAD(P)-dependent dehydrogenase (short-subunit alcohol dehydrogenase family)
MPRADRRSLAWARSRPRRPVPRTGAGHDRHRAQTVRSFHGPWPCRLLRIEIRIDIDEDGAVATLRKSLADIPAFDLAFVVAGVATEAGIPAGQIPREIAAAVLRTNALSPIRFAEASHRGVSEDDLAVPMTSKLSSVSLDRSGGWGSYRASKAAPNTLACSLAGQHSGVKWGVLLMHPGRSPDGSRRPSRDARCRHQRGGMVAVIEAHRGHRGCAFLDYTGATLSW